MTDEDAAEMNQTISSRFYGVFRPCGWQEQEFHGNEQIAGDAAKFSLPVFFYRRL